jgi:hypothetical protein
MYNSPIFYRFSTVLFYGFQNPNTTVVALDNGPYWPENITVNLR